MTALDIALLVALGLAAWSGWRAGATGFAFRLGGLVVGGLIGFAVARALLSARLSPLAHLALGLLCAVGFGLIGRAIGTTVGEFLRAGARRVHLGGLDRVAGASLSAAVALFVVWFVVGGVLAIAPPSVRQAVGRSAVLRRALPPTDRATADLQRALGGALPADVLALVPWAGTSTHLRTDAGANNATVDGAERSASRSVVKVLASGCDAGAVSEGTGFVAGRDSGSADLVVTNAHVVRGASDVIVHTDGGEEAATVTGYNAAADLAVLRVPDLHTAVLGLAPEPAANGTSAVVLGYPEDGPLTAVSAVVIQRLPTLQAGQGVHVREVYRIRAAVRHGNSGSPLIDSGGAVIGVVNALDSVVSGTGYALTLPAVRSALDAARGAAGPTGTGSCA